MLLKSVSFISLTAKGSNECFKSQKIFRIWKTNGSHNFLNLQNSQYFTRFTKSLWETLIPLLSASRRIHEAPFVYQKLLLQRKIWYQMNGHCLKTGLFFHTSLIVQGHERYLKETSCMFILEVRGNPLSNLWNHRC